MAGADDISRLELTVGRYMLFGQVGAGGMGCVHLGRRVGAAGFSRLVAIKRLHPHLGKQKDVVYAFLDEARIAARITHPNVVSIDDVVMDGDEVLLVMEYIHGRSLSFLAQRERERGRPVPPPIAIAIAVDILHGLQAAHEARDERGELLNVIHRDVSPHNVLVGADGVGRVLDFGIAKALGRLHNTASGSIKGKLPYMAPERLLDEAAVTTSVDLYAAAIVIWELLEGKRFHVGDTEERLISQVIAAKYQPLSDPALGSVNAILERALRANPAVRFASCRELGQALEEALDPASRNDVATWVKAVAGDDLDQSADIIAEIEQRSMRIEGGEGAETGTVDFAEKRGQKEPEARVEADEPAPPTLPSTTPSKSRTMLLFVGAGALVLLAIAFVASRSKPTMANASPPPPAMTTTPNANAGEHANTNKHASANAHADEHANAAVPVPTSTTAAAPAKRPIRPPPVVSVAPVVTAKPAPPVPKDDEAPTERK